MPLVAAQSYQVCSGYTDVNSHALHMMRVITSVTKGLTMNTVQPRSISVGIALGPVFGLKLLIIINKKGEIKWT